MSDQPGSIEVKLRCRDCNHEWVEYCLEPRLIRAHSRPPLTRPRSRRPAADAQGDGRRLSLPSRRGIVA